MRLRQVFVSALFLLVIFAAVVLMILPAAAEPVTDRILSTVHVSENKQCAALRIGFNFRVDYTSHFPFTQGDELRIKFRFIDPEVAAREILTKTETIRPPSSERAAVKKIEFETNGSGLTLTVYFRHHVFYKVAQGTDFTSIVVAVPGTRPSDKCDPVFPIAGAEDRSSLQGIPGAKRPPSESPARDLPDVPATNTKKAKRSGKVSDADRVKVKKLIKEARAALTAGKVRRAVQLLTKVLTYSESEFTPEAQELLGLARERKGQLAHAKAEYEEYLRRYPSGAGARRVKQRLAGIVTARKKPKGKLRKGKNQPTDEDEDGWKWGVSGSFSQFYFRNEGFRKFDELNGTSKETDVYQNSLLNSVDLIATAENDAFEARMRFSGSYENDFSQFGDDGTSVSSLYVEPNFKNWNVLGRFGRQSRNTGGVLGRFDGGWVSWQAMPMLGVNVVGGSPVESSKDKPLTYGRYLYGVSLDIGPFLDNKLDTTVFFIDQWVDSLVDRRAVGAEFRYFDTNKSAFGTIDYDVHFMELGTAIFSGSYSFPDHSTVNISLDYRNTPYLTTTNALQGQGVESISELLDLFTASQIKQLAEDRTARSWSGTLGFSHPINEKFQFNIDATVTETSATETSGGIDAIPSTGLEYFLSTQLVGTSMLVDGDIYVLGARYANTSSSDLFLIDFYTRFPVNDSLKVRPRLRLGYREGDSSDLEEFLVLPSIRANYYWSRAWSFEVDVGAKWVNRNQFGSSSEELEYFLTIGHRYDFGY